MNTPETINIEKYAEALNNLIGVDSAYFQGDKDVDAIVEVIVAAKKLENRVKELEKEKCNLEYTLLGVMHSVDKWLDGEELEMDEVNRAITMREKTLQIVENLTEKWGEAINQVNYIADVTRADTVHKTQKKLEEKIDRSLSVFDFNISECNAVRQVLRGIKNDIYQVTTEMLEGKV